MSAVTLFVDGRELRASSGESVAAALLNAGVTTLRTSVQGMPRGPVCGMGVCFECRVRIDGTIVRACLTPVREGMRIETGSGT